MSLHSRNEYVRTPSVHSLQQWRDLHTFQSPTGSNTTLDTVHRTYNRQLTPNSLHSFGSVSSSPLRIQSENLAPNRVPGRGLFHSADDASLCPSPQRSSRHSSYKSSWGNDVPTPPRCRTASTLIRESGPLEDIDLNSPPNDDEKDDDSDKENQAPIVQEPRLSFEVCQQEVLSINEPVVASDHVSLNTPAATSPILGTSRSFKRWISHLRPEALKHKKTLIKSSKRWPLEDSPKQQTVSSPVRVRGRRTGHKKSHSGSSGRFVGAVKAVAMVRQTSTPVSRKSRRSNLFSRSNRSSRLSEDQARSPIDRPQLPSKSSDEAALARSIQRQRTMDEILESEASYVADLKVLIHAYLTLLASASMVSHSTSAQIHQSVTEMLQLHETLLSQIRQVFKEPPHPFDSVRREMPLHTKQHRQRHTEGHRITSAVVGLVHAARTSIDSARPAPTATISAAANTTHVAAIVKIFEKMLARFFIYEEYGAQYELMLRNMTLTSKTISHWQAFERSIEALANSLSTSSGSEESAKKGLAFEDLLIKPIQRICKYPLLFEELYSNTFEADDAATRTELGEMLTRLREVTNEINKATNDRATQDRIQRAWRLQDLMILPYVSTSLASLRMLGYPVLCGVLYVAWESGNGIHGEYVLCALFKSHLVLAIEHPGTDRYDVVAIINLSDTQLENADDGRGLQCHTAPFSWKLVFEASQQLYELIFCACSSSEEKAWTRAIIQYVEKACQLQRDETPLKSPIYTTLILDAKPLGPIFGMLGSVTRRLSIQRAATVHSRANGAQVIIRNTTAAKESKDDNDSIFSSIGRSKSVTTANHVPILAPKRSDRSRMEASLSDVWSRDRLPFPGMSTHKGDHPLRASASSMMRRLSRASINSTFSKRSASTTSCAEIKPGVSVPDLQKIGEGDDDRDPRLDAYQSLRSTPGDFDQAFERRLHGSGRFKRLGTVKGVRLSDATNRVKGGEIPRLEARTVRVESTDKGSPRIVRHGRSMTGGLLRGLSTDTLKVWRA